jgi:hypothetical protein
MDETLIRKVLEAVEGALRGAGSEPAEGPTAPAGPAVDCGEVCSRRPGVVCVCLC